MENACLDRRVATQVQGESAVQPLSHLRGEPFVVLLGEPGAGKSTALEHEARAESGEIATCREVMNGSPIGASGTAYLDALDEYRSGDGGKDKLLRLANAISKSNIRRWRLTCRAEDWRATADINAMRRATSNRPIIVAHLLPLSEEEAQSVVASLGEPDPDRFVSEARNRGAGAFLENPLSLRLLHSVVVSNGVWPTSRFDLFASATSALAHEHDPERETDPRPGAEEILAAASAMSFYFLVSGAKALWRSNALPPGSSENEYVATHALGIDASLLQAALDTAIFRGEGHAFAPFHRTVAEFLAGRFLARKVTGAAETPAFPLRRAIALITGSDQKAPSELRGLYAWFAAHLQSQGDSGGARRLIQHDAATVLAYGDAATFDTAGRREILNHLDRDDPFFLESQDDATVFGGLAGEDLADDFEAILDAEVRSHLQVTVLRALADGPPVMQMSEKLREIVLDASRPLWMRERAAKILVSKVNDKDGMQRGLLNDLAGMTVDRGQLAIRALVLSSRSTQGVQFSDLHALLNDFDSLPAETRDGANNDDISSLVSLSIAIASSPRPDFFDNGVGRSDTQRRHKSQVQSLLDRAFVATIDANPDISAKRLLTWIGNLRAHRWDMLDSDVVEAIRSWIDHDSDRRELELFLALEEERSSEVGPWAVNRVFISTAGRLPSDALIRGLLDLANTTKKGAVRKRLFQVAAYAALSEPQWPKWQEPIVSLLEQEGGFKGFIKSVLSDPHAKWKKREAKRKAKQDQETERSRNGNVAQLTPNLAAIASGAPDQFGVLRWAANNYRNGGICKDEAPLEKIVQYTNREIAAAIAEGFVQFAINTENKVDVEDLGKAEASNSAYDQEFVVGAGLHQALLHGRENDIDVAPLTVAVVGLRQAYFSADDDPSIAAWAVDRLASDPDQGAAMMVRYWNAALEAGDDDLDAIHHLTSADRPELVSLCMVGLLGERPGLPDPALRQAIRACAASLGSSQLAELVRLSLDRDDLERQQRDIWSFVGLALMPEEFADRLAEGDLEKALLAPNGDIANTLNELCPNIDLLNRIRIGALGKKYPARDDGCWHYGGASGIVRAAIRRLGASNSVEAGEHLKELATTVDSSWAPHMAHAAAEHARKRRDEQFAAPSVSQLTSALANGSPATPSDLAAIVLEEVERYKGTLRTGSEMPWKRFWNTDGVGAATQPQIENEDRDRLLELIRPRFERYDIVASLPEARRGENTRADILMLSHAGKCLPIEAKRHYNKELWTAASTQLSGYAADPDAFGFGIYLVFWFGTEFRVPKRNDGAGSPESAEALKAMLVDDLRAHVREKLSVVVLDVSRPQSMIEAIEKKRRRKA
ncbi:MAG: hypothetical protein NXH97_18890 [Rhodobacteraceae bacterium]|nr:hypothetical protein [Paracoccaceae bacterium]